MTAYNRDEARRLVFEARERATRQDAMAACCDCVDATAIADQLEAADVRIAELEKKLSRPGSLTCDHKGCSAHFFGMGETEGEVRSEAQRAGWDCCVGRDKASDYCPKHTPRAP